MPHPPEEIRDQRRREIGSRIRALRQAHGLSQAKLAVILSVEQSHVSNIERGVRSATIQQVTKLAKRLGVTTDAILGRREVVPAVTSMRSGKLYRYLQRIEELSPPEQKAVLQILDSLLTKHANGK